MDINESNKQLSLYGYNKYFKFFTEIYKKNKLPNCILINGSKGLGKATFVYHFINSILSENESNSYSRKYLKIDKNNPSYQLMLNNTHPNFFSFAKNNMKIDDVRNLLLFLNKSTYLRDLKIVFIDNFEKFNLNSTNALLKAIEEPSINTFFFIVQDSSYKIPETIISRCMKFKIFFSENDKKNIFHNLSKDYSIDTEKYNLDDNLYLNTPGNLIRFFSFLESKDIIFNDDYKLYISTLLDNYLKEKNIYLLNFASYLIEKFYVKLCLDNNQNISIYMKNFSKIMYQIYKMKKFNLYEKNTLIFINDTLKYETK